MLKYLNKSIKFSVPLIDQRIVLNTVKVLKLTAGSKYVIGRIIKFRLSVTLNYLLCVYL